MDELRDQCLRMVDLQEKKAALTAQITEIERDLDLMRLIRIPETMDFLGVKNCTFEGIGRVQLASDLYASTRKDKKDDAMQWLRDLGYEGMISETYNAGSIKALFRRMIEDGKPIPDDIFSITPFIRASIVKA